MSEDTNTQTIVIPSNVVLETAASRFAHLLKSLIESDEQMLAADGLSIEEVGEHLRVNLDDLKFAYDSLKARAAFFAEYEQAFAAKKQAILNNAALLKERIGITMQEKEMEKVPGNLWRVQLNTSESVKPKSAPTALLRSKYPDLIEVKYGWKLTPLKEAIEAGHVPPEIAVIETKKFAQFYANSGTAKTKSKKKGQLQ